jgi:hypothetical protein
MPNIGFVVVDGDLCLNKAEGTQRRIVAGRRVCGRTARPPTLFRTSTALE